MPENIFNIGIMAQPEYRKRTIAIARGEYIPAAHEPKIWFESLQSMAQVLSNENQKLLKIIIDNQPQSLKELETLSGRSKSNLSRTLKTLEHYGIVETHKNARHLIPTVKATDFRIEFGLGSSEDIGLN
ncbi:MarR family transcriptional regulator [Syntrophotalea acetylenica]|uniref:HVO_A0114 family putative DNA-binding protein n=1 Tax=Syntrophotalea acetylenica TaxID=29542 RepID=UPI002A359C5F|nr:MarR family transcriptional regulator [Syntrophotalea acetylenica]MDY0263543.1 MarR family transcriptional regulator [Syntrophotalea acetylenica]